MTSPRRWNCWNNGTSCAARGRNNETGEIEYGFRHCLVRDVVTGQLPRAVRSEKQERAAAWFAEPAVDLMPHVDRRTG
ncbi:hypothetical protein [Lentzea atacamensis]|uniref:hypothetical protein n=1 Tax=Lentzea atacamensis TaxID=531938 RepID=UPI0011BED6A3|nr:hypothetical protein [Lentzea atacamensis]